MHKGILMVSTCGSKVIVLFGMCWFTLSSPLYAGRPVWTFTPLTATSVSVSRNSTAVVQYQVTNQSSKSHRLVMTPIPGVTQTTTGTGICGQSFILPSAGSSCILSLTVDGSQLTQPISDGPIVCEQGSTLQCYKPDPKNILRANVDTFSTTLSASLSNLALSVADSSNHPALTGTPRVISITNTGSNPALNVSYFTSSLPSGTSILPSSCGTILPSGQCDLTITPGNTPSAAVSDTAPIPITLSVSGTNTNTLTSTITILTYGSVYQGGYVYAVNDSTPNTGSIGGKVAALTDQSSATIWSSNGAGNVGATVSFDLIPGISETSTTSSGAPTYQLSQSSFDTTYSNANTFPFPSASSFFACDGATDGACNSANILTLYNTYITNYMNGSSPPFMLSSGPTALTYYAAGLCTGTISGYSDWHLPAICELGYDDLGLTSCGTATAPTTQNMQSNLFDANIGGLVAEEYWSSTQPTFDNAWFQDFYSMSQFANSKDFTLNVRCARAFVP